MAFQKNQILTLSIESLSNDGSGVPIMTARPFLSQPPPPAMWPKCASSSP